MELITAKEAADIIGVGPRQLSALARQGFIRTQHKKGDRRTPYYDPNEIVAYADMKQKGITFAEIAAMAQQNRARVTRLERVVNRLLGVIGADTPTLKLDRQSVISMHLTVEDALELPVYTSKEVLDWSKIFYSIGEEYFEEVANIFNTPEPWKPYLELAKRMAKKAPFRQMEVDIEVKATYNYLKLATRFVRQAAFFYVRGKSGSREAYRTFPESTGDPHEDILSITVLDYANPSK